MHCRNPSSVISFVLALLVILLRVASADAQPKALPDSSEELVALLIGEDLHRSFMNRRQPDSVAANAARALFAKADKAVPALDRALDSKDPVHRLNIVFVLTMIHVPATTPALIRAARDESINVRTLAISSLPVYADAEAYKTAWAALADQTAAVQNAAVSAFSPLRNARTTPPPGNPVKFQVAQKISELLKNAETRYAAADVLGHLGMNIAVRPLLAAMTDDRPMIRYTIITSLGQIKDKQATVEMVRYLKDPDPYVRMYTAKALGHLGDMRATPGLLVALADSQDFVRREAAAALGEIGDWRATQPLIALINDPLAGISAIRALGQIGDRQAVDGLVKALSMKDNLAATAATSLGQLGDPRAAPHLGQYLETHLESKAAADALVSIRHPDAVAELAKVASTHKSIVARRALDQVAGTNFGFGSPEGVALWWKENRDTYFVPASTD
jgi:HEAT repeat protein